MSRALLVDSPWYIQKARNGVDPLLELSLVADARDIATCGMVVAEVGRGLKIPQFLDLDRHFNLIPGLTVTD